MISKIIKFIRKNGLLTILIIGVVLFFSNNAKAAFPIISDTGSSSVTSVSAVVTWQTDINSNSLVDFGTTTNYGNTLGNSGESVMSHSVNLTGLSPDTTYKYRVRSKNGGDETIDDNGGLGYEFTTAASPVISNVRLSVMNDTFVTITWQTSTNAYPFVAYGTTDSYGRLVGDEENLGTSHIISIAGVTPGTVYHYLPRVKDIYGNYTSYGIDNTFTLGAPHLQSFTSGTADGIYGPSGTVNITANYSENLDTGSTATVVLDNGVSVTLDSISGSTLSGTYTVGATGSGEDSSALNVSSISSQSVCDANPYCYNGTTLPVTNINSASTIVVDTTAPSFSAVSPASSIDIDSVTTASDISYTLLENLSSGTILITRTSGSVDGGSPHTCTLSGSYLNEGSHNNFDINNCVEEGITLVDGATYSFEFNGFDLAGNAAGVVIRSEVTFDNSNPVLQSFSSTTTDGIYGPSSNINITATYDENLDTGSTATVVLDNGVSVTLDSISGSTLSGTYTVGATGSGEDSSALNVSSIFSQNACDEAGNCQTATTLPGINIDNGVTLIIDTTSPAAPSEVSFVTNPVNSSNENSATLRVAGEAEATIFYSIDDGDAGTGAVEGNAVMEVDGSTDITLINLTSLTDGSLTATVYLRDIALNSGASSQGVVTKDTINPEFTIQYYSDLGLLSSLEDNPSLGVGTYYLKVVSNEALSAVPTISIDAEGTANDVSSTTITAIGGNEYSYTRVISYEGLAVGSVLENISISATDSNDNSVVDANPTNEISKAAYTDTVKPTVTGTVLPAIAGTVSGANVSLTFNEAMDQTVSPEVLIKKSDSSTLGVSGIFVSETEWQGTTTLSASDTNGVAVLEVSLASDLAGNVMDSNTSVDDFVIDTADPVLIVVEGTDIGPVNDDAINITTSDTGSGVSGQYYGFSTDSVCDGSDTIDTAFASGVDFIISGNHTDYLCAKVEDNAGNTSYITVGQLNTDNSSPTIDVVSSNHANGVFTVGEIIDIDVTFSEPVTSTGDVTVTLETGTIDHSCTFAVTDSTEGTCNYTVQAGDTSSDLNVNSISGTIEDQTGNSMTNFTPATNLADNKNIVIDTTAPSVNITAPLGEERVNSNFVITFDNNETTSPECSIDNINWVYCSSGSTTLSDLIGWATLPDGNFTLYLSDTDVAGNTGSDSEVDIFKDTAAPTIDSVSSDVPNGSYKEGQIIDIDVTFSEPVTSTGDVTITLETGETDRTCSFTVTDSTEGTCNYTVQAGDTSSDLNVNSISGTIEDQTGFFMTNFEPGSNLADNKNIVIDTIRPTIDSINSDKPNGSYDVGDIIDIDVTFSEPVTSLSLVTVTLDSGGSCTFSAANNSLASCNYVVAEEQNSADLNVVSITGDLADQAGNAMTDMSIPSGHNLADNKDIRIDTTTIGDPIITNVTSDHENGIFRQGEVIDIDFTFSEIVTSSGFVTVTLDSGGSCTFTVADAIEGACNYTVGSGQNSSDLNVANVSGTIEDQAGNLMTNFAPTTNLADNKDIVIDTIAPDAPVVTLTNPITDENRNNVSITGTGEGSTSVSYSIDDENASTMAVTGSSSVSATGDINITGIDLSSLDGGMITASVTLTDLAGNVSSPGEATATSTVVRPTISNITSNHANGSFTVGEVIDINVTFSEAVTSIGNVTITLETGVVDRNCAFTITNATEGTCDYTVQAGDTSSDLNVADVSGTIEDQAGNLMTNFTPAINLADNKDIVIDTTAPNAPVVALTNPITDENRNNVSITGTGEGSTSISYSIDDENASTAAVTGSSSVSVAGDINITGIDLSLLDGGTITASLTLTDLAGNVSDLEEITAVSTVNQPVVTDINSNHADGSFTVGEVIDIDVTFSEAVTSTGNVTITLETGETDRTCSFSVTDSTEGTCNYTVQAGDTSPDLDVSDVSGTIEDQAGNLMTNFTPITNLADNKNIVIDTTMPVIDSFISTTEDGTYASDSEINITAVYNENIESGSTIDVLLDNGVAVTLDTILDSTKLIGTYTVGATGSGESTSDLEVSSISSQNVCDTAGNCQTSTTLPSTNISSGSTIAVDTTAPIFHSISPENSENIDSVTTNSDISYSLSEDLASGTIEFTRTAWEEDPNSPHICTLEETFLYEGVHNSFDTSNCQEGGIDLVDGSIYTIAFEGIDMFGNVASSIEKTGISFGMDKEAPIISSVAVSDITSKKATITWVTDEDSDSYVEYGLTADLGEVYGNKTLTKNHSIVLPSILVHSSLYYYRVNSTDSYGNKAVSQIKTFNTLTTSSDEESGSGEGENIAGISSIEVSDTTSSSAVVTWKTSEICNGIVRYGLDEEYGYSAAEDTTIESYSTFSNEHKVLLTGLFSNSTYNYKVVSYDIYGNISLSGNEKFTTSSLSTVSGVKVENITLNSATITWETGDPISSEVEYGLTTSYGETVGEETLTNYHKIEITGLQAGQTYHFRVKGSTDDEGLVASDDYVFATYPKPQVNNHELVSITDSSATIKWETNIPTEAVIEYLNIDNPEDKGVQGASEITDEHNVEILGLEQGSEYQVKIKGVDINKNDFESDSFTITTDKDLDPPIISDINIDTSLSSQKNDNVQAIVFWKTDEASTSQVVFNSGMDNAQDEFQEESAEDKNLTTNHLVVLTNLKPGMIYQFKTISKDKNENKGESEVYTVLTPRKEESVIQMIISNFQQTFGWMNKLKK